MKIKQQKQIRSFLVEAFGNDRGGRFVRRAGQNARHADCKHKKQAGKPDENADPDVQRDLLLAYAEAFPDRKAFRHAEGNSAAHAKASAMGSSATIIIEQGKLLLGTWQDIYFCEFDGVRNRTFYVKILADTAEKNRRESQ